MSKIKIGNRYIGDNEKVFIIAEIGINHNGSLRLAKRLIKEAFQAGAEAVKFQKRTPELCVPVDQWYIERDTPWGRMTYIDYRFKVELSLQDYSEIDRYCKKLGIIWSASCWDEDSVDFIEQFDVPFYKAASASLTDQSLLNKKRSTGKPLMISTGMSTLKEIKDAVKFLGKENLMIAHSTSSYPCKLEELNLKMITTLQKMYIDIPIGYSGHETGLSPTWAAVALGANFVERHITLDRAMWGSDQAASVEPGGFKRLVENIRDIEKALGDGIKKIYDSEVGQRKKLRRAIS
ncbi:MAG TPA: N-acetylneuraminate synthase family protein [Ignavibacteria bacterium]|nr:N-acetylneuraminate synthase family protein [Ignavibacteria bacterium]HQY51073.1 N-acetylneuraminate synthase family protein [Ignavibacteria bacterium]HRB00460.1 N-acetylneuraminate synthase family protein [Ignavibacteria bacterium]